MIEGILCNMTLLYYKRAQGDKTLPNCLELMIIQNLLAQMMALPCHSGYKSWVIKPNLSKILQEIEIIALGPTSGSVDLRERKCCLHNVTFGNEFHKETLESSSSYEWARPTLSPYLRKGKWLLAPKQPHSAFGQHPDCQLGRKALQSPLLPFLLLLCTVWIIGVLIDPSGLTLSQETCWNKIRQMYSYATEWLSSRCWQAPLEGLRPACHQAQILTSSSPPSTLNASYGSDT